MGTEETEKVQAIVAGGVAREGLDDVVLPAGEAAAKRLADFVSDAAVDRMIADAIRGTGKEVADLNREEKVALISRLESKGAFLIRYSVERIAKSLNLSKYTIYNYLDEVKTRGANAEVSGADVPAREGTS